MNNRLRSASNNMQSALNNPDLVDKYIANEVAAHRVIAVDTSLSFNLSVHVSRFGVIPTKISRAGGDSSLTCHIRAAVA